MANKHNRYCKKCYNRTTYLYHDKNDFAYTKCNNCNKIYHLHETIGEPRFKKLKDISRNKRINAIGI